MRTHDSRRAMRAALLALALALGPRAALAKPVLPTTGAPTGTPYGPAAAISGIDRSVMSLETVNAASEFRLLTGRNGALYNFLQIPQSPRSRSQRQPPIRPQRQPTIRPPEIARTGDFPQALIDIEAINSQLDKIPRSDLSRFSIFAGGRYASGNDLVLPEVILGDAIAGIDVGFQEHARASPGTGLTAKYALPLKGGQASYSQALGRAIEAQRVVRNLRDAFPGILADAKRVNPNDDTQVQKFFNDTLAKLLKIVRVRTVPPPLPGKPDDPQAREAEAIQFRLSELQDDLDALKVAVTDYSLHAQASTYASYRSFIGQGDYAALGLILGGLLPARYVPPPLGGIYVSALAQGVQFDATDPAGGQGHTSGYQFGFALVYQNHVNTRGAARTGDDYRIHAWRYKLGAEYYTKVYGSIAQPETYDFFWRYRRLMHQAGGGKDEHNAQLYDPTYLELTPFFGWGGPGHRFFSGATVGMTTPINF